jgi:hypothetical protein
MMFEHERPGLSRIQQWRILMNVGRPVEHAPIIIPWRLIALVGLLILVGLWGLAAAGAEWEPVKKGSGGLGTDQIGALEKSKNFSDLSDPTLYNFLQNPIGPVRDAVADKAPAPHQPREHSDRTQSLQKPTSLLMLLGMIVLATAWLNVRARR